MTTTSAVYTQAILTIFDSLSPEQVVILRDDLRLKKQRLYEMQPLEIVAIEVIEELLETSALSRRIN